MPKDYRLKIIYESDADRVLITGDEKGFESLIKWCKEIIRRGKLGIDKDPDPHIHLQWQTNNTEESSTETVLVFSDDPEDYNKQNTQKHPDRF